jgi:hypothetical protein
MSKRTFNPNRDYSAKYTFVTRFSESGDITNVSAITITIPGRMIVKDGLKSVIRFNAKKLDLPKEYSCVVDVD